MVDTNLFRTFAPSLLYLSYMKKIFWIVCALAISAATYANTFATFTLEKADGTTNKLPAIGTKITFSSSVVSAINASVSSNILLNQVAYMYFNDATVSVGVDNVALRDVHLVSTDGAILLTAPAGMTVRVLNVTGQTIATLMSTGDEQTIASALSEGVYMVQIGGQTTIKTIVR